MCISYALALNGLRAMKKKNKLRNYYELITFCGVCTEFCIVYSVSCTKFCIRVNKYALCISYALLALNGLCAMKKKNTNPIVTKLL